jgi:hypothetical protein
MQKIMFLIILFGFAAPVLTHAQVDGGPVLPQDKGPKIIDVSSYPPDVQQSYHLFASKCSKCHTLARPINTTMSTPEWMRYVLKMQRKPGSSITEPQAKTICDFLTYDQSVRKSKNLTAFYRLLSDDEINALREKN